MNDVAVYRLEDGDNYYYYAMDSGLKIADGVSKEVGGKVVDQLSIYQEYQDFSGVKYPIEITKNMGFEIKLQIENLNFNVNVSEDQFR